MAVTALEISFHGVCRLQVTFFITCVAFRLDVMAGITLNLIFTSCVAFDRVIFISVRRFQVAFTGVCRSSSSQFPWRVSPSGRFHVFNWLW